jgi:DNA end-binding protein Ku
LRLERFIDAAHVDPRLFAGRSLYLAPDGLAAQRPYAVLAQALCAKSKWGIGRVVLSGHRQVILLRSANGLLVVDVLYYPAQLRAAPGGSRTGNDPVAIPEELHLAGLLIDAASGPVDWPQYRDDSAAELAALIEAKVAGRPLVSPAAEPVAVLSLLEALKQSVAAAQGDRGATESPPIPSRKPRRRRTA